MAFKNTTKSVVFLSLGVLILDFFWHSQFTQDTIVGGTNFTYYLFKIAAVIFLSFFLFQLPKITNKVILIYGVYFTLIMSVYYRFYEFFSGLNFGAIAPDIVLGTTTITLSDTLLFPGLWLIAHSLVFIIPLWLLRDRLK